MSLTLTDAEPKLGYLHHLYEVGTRVSNLALEEARILADLKSHIEQQEERLTELRNAAEGKVRKLWSPGEIDNAKAHAQMEIDCARSQKAAIAETEGK